MNLQTYLETEQAPTLFRAFRDLIGEEHWIRRAERLRSEIRGNEFLTEWLQHEYWLAFALDKLSALERRSAEVSAADLRPLYPSLAFIAQAMSIIGVSPTEMRPALVQRVRGAIKNSDDLRALRLEFAVATHLLRLGHRVVWPEIESQGRIDLLCPDLDAGGLQIECKAVSADKGRKIHAREALNFSAIAFGELRVLMRNLRTGLAIVLTVPDRLPRGLSDLSQLAARLMHQVMRGRSGSVGDGARVAISEFDPAKELRSRPHTLDRDVIDRLTGTKNRFAIARKQGKGSVILVLQSAKDDALMKYVYAQLKSAAENQLCKSSPGLLVVGLDALSRDDLAELAAYDQRGSQLPTALRMASGRFLARGRDHVIGVAWLSHGKFVQISEDVFSERGAAYYFPRRESQFWHEDFGQLFN